MKGFTLLEILLALGLLALVAVGVVFLPLGFKRNVDLDGQSEQIIEALNIGQSNAKSRRDNAAWGVHLESGLYILFKGSSYNPADSSNQAFYLVEGLRIDLINLNGGGSDVIFAQFSGETSNFGTFRVRFVSDPSKYREVRVDLAGRSSVSGSTLMPSGSRVYDSRHAHFQLNWTIKNSTKITFSFPRLSQINEVIMAEYFNADKSDFNWAGNFIVGGKTQEFKVHTHSLTLFDSLLSITRDRSADKNNEEVRIYVDYDGANREITHYLSDGSVTVGDYGGVMAVQ